MPFASGSHIHFKLGKNAPSPLQTTTKAICYSVNSWTSKAHSAVEMYHLPFAPRQSLLSLKPSVFPTAILHSPTQLYSTNYYSQVFSTPPSPPASPYFLLYPLTWIPSYLPDCLPGQSYTEAAPSWSEMWIFFPCCICWLIQSWRILSVEDFCLLTVFLWNELCIVVFQWCRPNAVPKRSFKEVRL